MTAPGGTSSSSAPKPLPFAIMRNTHEAIRGAVTDCDAALASGDMSSFSQVFRETIRGINVHGLLEDEGLFPLLDEKFDNEATKNGLPDLHVAEVSLEEAVFDAIASKDIEKAATSFAKWKEHHLSHLKKEENVMMPRVMDMAKMVDRDPARMGEMLNEKVLGPVFDDDPEEMAWFVRWNARVLIKHGSEQQDSFTAMRVWVWGFQWACTPQQWETVLPGLRLEMKRDNPEFYERLCTEFDIEGPGKVQPKETTPNFFWFCCWRVPLQVEEEEDGDEKQQESKEVVDSSATSQGKVDAPEEPKVILKPLVEPEKEEPKPKERSVEPAKNVTPKEPAPASAPKVPTTTISTNPDEASFEVETVEV